MVARGGRHPHRHQRHRGRPALVAALTLGITGATGFVGTRLLDAARAAGHKVRALTRRPQDAREGVDWIDGSLEDPASLHQLADGADAIIHVAGVINARDGAGFEAGNVAGTVAMLDAAKAAGVKRFVHVSSLAAREPQLSMYGASKARSEVRVNASDLSHAIVRPPAVYGPGDRETLELFRMARRGIVLLPPRGRISIIHADDLADLLLALAAPDAPSGLTVEPDDGHAGGYSHEEFARALGIATGTGRPLTLHAPAAMLNAAAFLDRLVRGKSAKLTPDRAAYFAHPDWVASPALKAPANLWTPRIATPEGLAATASWYEEKGWL